MPLIVGLMGQKQSGKDTFASRLVSEHGFVRVAFADALRAVAYQINPLIGDNLRLAPYVDIVGWDAAKNNRPEVRRVLQEVGLAVRDNVEQGAWVDRAWRDVSVYWRANRDVVITDVRFPNEADDLRAREDGILVRVDRPGLPDGDAHISEHAWRDIEPDVIVTNSGSIEALHTHADALVALWRGGLR